jgi:uncharacterized BrkB/YihY/UPF0761 family membrane protein
MTPPQTPRQPLKGAGLFSLFLFALAVVGLIAAIGLFAFRSPFSGTAEFGSFVLLAALLLGALIFVFVVVPCWWLYKRVQDRRARLSLWIGRLSLVMILLYVLALFIFQH